MTAFIATIDAMVVCARCAIIANCDAIEQPKSLCSACRLLSTTMLGRFAKTFSVISVENRRTSSRVASVIVLLLLLWLLLPYGEVTTSYTAFGSKFSYFARFTTMPHPM